MAEDADFGFEAGFSPNLIGQIVGPSWILSPGGQQNNAGFAASQPALDVLNGAVHTGEIFWNKYFFCAAGDGNVDRNKTGITTHHFNNKKTIMTGRRVANTVDRIKG